MIKLGIVNSAYLGHYGLEEGLRRMKEQGYERIDFQDLCNTETPLFENSAEYFENILGKIRKATEEYGIEISQTHGPWRYPPRDFTPEDRAERLEKMKKAIWGTAILGSENMVIHPIMPFGPDNDPDKEKLWDMNGEFMLKLADEGQKYGVTVCFENMPMRALSISSPEAVLKFVKMLNHPYFKVCLDTGHCAVLAKSVGESVRLIGKDYLRTLHIHDNDGRGDQHLHPYSGAIDWEDFSSALCEIGFEGTASLETSVKGDVPDGDNRTAKEKELLAKLKKIANRQ